MRVQPLSGIRVLDLSAYLPGNLTAQLLADFGATVIKVEPPFGDPARRVGEQAFMANRNKRFVALNLKAEGDREIALRLAASCDVFIECFRPGVAERLGVSLEAVRGVRPDVVYVSMSGYGQDGPLAQLPGHDLSYLAGSGALSFSGHWGEAPRRGGLPVVDISGALYAALTIVVALRSRDATGVGAHLDLSLFDVAMSLSAVHGGKQLTSTNDRQIHLWPTNDVFVTADGKSLAVAAIEEHLFQNLRNALVSEDERLLDDGVFGSEGARREHGDYVKAVLASIFLQHTREEWLRRFKGRDIPVEPVRTVQEAATNPQTVARGQLAELNGERHLMHPVLWDAQQPAALERTLAEVNQDYDEVMAELELLESRASS